MKTEFAAGRYVVERVLGKGGQKVVYLVRDTRLMRPCALSLLGDESIQPDDVARLDHEARALARAGAHPNVVTVFDLGEEGGRPFIVSEYIPGGALSDELSQAGGPLSVPRVFALLRDLLRALTHVHQCGIVHRDLKPSNVWIAADGTPKLGDFGLAISAEAKRLTEVGGIVGSPGYLAPEQITGGEIDGRTDLYALGCLTYELLSGRPPFSGPLASVFAQHLHATPSWASLPELPPAIDQLLRALLKKAPQDRPPSALAALETLEAALSAAPSAGSAIRRLETHEGVGKPCVAVLPFASEDEWFGEGIAEDTITSLSKFRSLVVIARGSSFRYRSQDLARIKSELGAHYVVDGRVRRTPERILISVELVRADDGRNLWAERYDRPANEIFQIQDDVTRTIVATLVNRVEAARLEEVRRAPTESLAAYDCLLRGKDHHHRHTLEDNARAQELLSRAIELDPDYALAHAWLACTLGQCMSMSRANYFDRFLECLQTAHSIDPNESECHRLSAACLMLTGRLDEALPHQERALALNPNDDRIVSQMGEMLTYFGRAEEALAWIRLAIRLNPFHLDNTFLDLGRALYCMQRWQEAADALQRISKPLVSHHAYLASCHLQLGDREAAERSKSAILAANPSFEVEGFMKSLLFKRREDIAVLERDLRQLFSGG
jgi:serine/threonine protein kinase/Tfp pilus assembly protein PilF